MRNLVFLPLLILLLTGVSCMDTPDLRPGTIGAIQNPEYPPNTAGYADHSQRKVNLTGDWEKNYDRSDDFKTEIQNYVLKIQNHIKELQQARERDSNYNLGGSGIPDSREALIGLAQFTEEITRMPVLHIVQDKTGVQIKRENDFPLTCEFFGKTFTSKSNTYGTENCAWSGGQLFIQINLDNGLHINYQVTLGPDAKKLNITTTVASREASAPLTISNYYDRYTEPTSDYNCVHTLTKNDVCTKAK